MLFRAGLPARLSAEVTSVYRLCVQAKPKLQTLFNPDAVPKPAADGGGGGTADAASPKAADEQGRATHSPGAGGPAGSGTAADCGDASASGAAASVGAVGLGALGSAGPAPLPGMPGGQEITFGAGIEEEANSYFQRIYTGAASIEDIVSLLKGFQASSSQKEQQVYACMVHNLFDEYRYGEIAVLL